MRHSRVQTNSSSKLNDKIQIKSKTPLKKEQLRDVLGELSQVSVWANNRCSRNVQKTSSRWEHLSMSDQTRRGRTRN